MEELMMYENSIEKMVMFVYERDVFIDFTAIILEGCYMDDTVSRKYIKGVLQ